MATKTRKTKQTKHSRRLDQMVGDDATTLAEQYNAARRLLSEAQYSVAKGRWVENEMDARINEFLQPEYLRP